MTCIPRPIPDVTKLPDYQLKVMSQAARKVVRVLTSMPEFPYTTTPQQYTSAELKKMKATELLVLLSQQGRVFNKRTRKQVLINAYLYGVLLC